MRTMTLKNSNNPEKIRFNSLEDIADSYNIILKGIRNKAELATSYNSAKVIAGQIRYIKGRMVEDLTKDILKMVCYNLGIEESRVSFDKNPVHLGIENDYYVFNQIDNIHVAEHILDNLDDYICSLETDVHLNIDKKFIINVECKTYTESAMLKRILCDSMLVKSVYPNVSCALVQLENALGGDYGKNTYPTFGSRIAHVIMSRLGVKLDILTLMLGNRRANAPLDKYPKPLDIHKLNVAADKFASIIKNKVIL